MVMYKQNQGLMAKGTMGTQATGGTTMPKKPQSYNLQSINFGGMSASGQPSVGSQIWGALNPMNWNLGPSAGTQPTPKPPSIEQQAPQPTTRAQRTELSQPEIMDLINNGYIYTARGMSNEGLRIAYDKMMSDRRAAQGRMSATAQTAPRTPEPAMQTTGSMSQQPSGVSHGQSSVLGANYRPPAQSAWANFENPFTPERQRLLEAQAVQQAEEQAAVTAGRLGSQLAGAGLMSGGGTGLSQSMAQQLAMQTEGQRSQALRDIALQVPMQRAELEARRAAGLDAYAPTAFGMSERIALQPSTIRRAEAEADIAGTTARRGEQMLPLDIQQQEITNRLTAAQADIARLRANIEADPEIINAKKREIIAKTGITEQEYTAAVRLIETTDPSLWYNHPGWGIAGSVVDNALKISQTFKNFATAGKQ